MPNAASSSSNHADNGDGDFWDVVEITDERRGLFKVKWAGVDPATGKSWPQSWVKSEDCTEDLIIDWRRKQRIKREAAARRKSGGTKTRGSTVSSRTKKDSRSSSTATATRQTRQGITNVPTAPMSNASSSRPRPDGAAVREHSLTPRKRRRATASEDADSRRDGSSRPAKKRKLEVEVVEPVKNGPSQESESSYPVIVRKKTGKRPLIISAESSDDGTERRSQGFPRQTSPNGKSRATHKRKPSVDENDEEEAEEDMDKPVIHHAVPVTKVGPPRNVKRRKGVDGKTHTRKATAEGAQTKDRLGRQLFPTSSRTESVAHSLSPPQKSNSSRAAQMTNTRPVETSRPAQVPGPSRSSSSRSEVADPAADNDPPATAHLWEVIGVTDDTPAPLSPDSRRLLMQEEEENTQEAAGFIPPQPILSLGSPQDAPESRRDPGPIKTSVRHGRPFANDTFSRDGIVPETQPTHAADILDEPPYDPTQDDLDAEQDIPSTPVRPRSDAQASSPNNPSSIVAKMQSRSRGKRKELRPIHLLPLPDFRAYLNATQTEDIDSSPEKETPPKKHTLGPLTQDTIEDDEPEDMIDRFVDWSGGAQNLLDMRPEEPFGQRSHSPEIPLQEPPPTSTTQRADADSQSIDQSQPNSQVVELTAALEEKSEQLSLLEEQIEGLQERIAELELVQAKDRTTHESELNALREISEEKTEQISLLENQLVELELQLTQLKDNDNQSEHKIRELNELLEERSEQVSQLESALLELHDQVEALELEKEQLTEKIQQHDARVGQSDETTAQRLAALEEELASAREKLSKAQDVVASLSDRLETTTQERTQQLKYAEEKRDLYEKLYSEASTHAQRLAVENAELEARAARAEGQVKEGLEMVRATSAKQVTALQAEAEKWKGMYQVGAERDKRTNDEVRRRAALEPGLREQNIRLRVDLHIANKEVADLKAIIEQLSAAQGRAGQGYNEDEDEDFIPDPDIASSSSSSSRSSSSEGSVPPERSSGALSRSPALRDDKEECVCQYVEGAVMCNARFATVQEAIDHACDAHYREGTLVTL